MRPARAAADRLAAWIATHPTVTPDAEQALRVLLATLPTAFSQAPAIFQSLADRNLLDAWRAPLAALLTGAPPLAAADPAALHPFLLPFCEAAGVTNPDGVAGLLATALLQAVQESSWKHTAYADHARAVLAAIAGAPGAPALADALRAFIGWKTPAPWKAALAATPPAVTRTLQSRQRTAAAGERRHNAMRNTLRALRARLDALGLSERLSYSRVTQLNRMLPASVPSFPAGLLPDHGPEPDWLAAPPPAATLAASYTQWPDELLVQAWHDRWVTAATAAEHLGISVHRVRQAIWPACDILTTANPHYRTAPPMTLARLSAVDAWAAHHPDDLTRWQQRSAASRLQHQARHAAALASLRAIPTQIQAATTDPAPLACFWLALLNRAAKSAHSLYQTKDAALRRLVTAGVPCVIHYVDGGAKPESVWLCDTCRDHAAEYGLHPLDYIDEVGPCPACTIEPAVPDYYDLYALRFTFPGIGTFRYHIPADTGRAFLPPAATLPHQERGDDGTWAYGRPLTALEAEAFSLADIRAGLHDALARLPQPAPLSAAGSPSTPSCQEPVAPSR